MAKNVRRTLNAGPPPSSRFSPFKELGASGVAVFGGRIATRENSQLVNGAQRWVTYSNIVANTSIVAAGVRYFLNIVANAKWTIAPVNDKGEGKEVAEFVDSVLNGMDTPWRRVARRAASYRFAGFGVQEWTAKRRTEDNKIGLEDIEARPQHTIDRWDVDDKGSVLGVWQVPPQTGNSIYLPRKKLLYLVEDSLTDSPEGLGLYRHLVDPYIRLQKYLQLEGQGFERDLRGIPIGRVPYQAIEASVEAGRITREQADRITRAVEDFVQTQSKKEDTSLVLDSAPYTVETDSGKSISGIMQYGIELLQGQAADFAGLNSAVSRLNQEMARVIGVEHLLLGSAEGSANRSLAEDKSANFYLVVNGSLDDICDGVNKDLIPRICDLNGIKEELRPEASHSDVAPHTVAEITAALRDMATAGAVLQPNDPAVDDVRDLLGIQHAPEVDPDMLGLVTGNMPPAPGEEDAEDEEAAPGAKPRPGFPPKKKTNGANQEPPA